MKKIQFNHNVGSCQEFYQIVKILNSECGHGNWTMHGRPLRKIKRIETYNRIATKHVIPLTFNTITHTLTIVVPDSKKSIQSRLLLEKV